MNWLIAENWQKNIAWELKWLILEQRTKIGCECANVMITQDIETDIFVGDVNCPVFGVCINYYYSQNATLLPFYFHK